MFCQQCVCEFSGWVGNCPQCQNQLISERPTMFENEYNPDSYEHVFRVVEKQAGLIQVHLVTIEVVKRKRSTFPYFGYGYAWEKEIRGDFDGLSITLQPSEVIFQRESRFPFRGFGFAWVKTFRGEIGGHPFLIIATKVNKKMNWIFPYFGFGRAWVDEYIGTFGESLKLEFVAKNIEKPRETRFPWRGYGYAWIQTGEFFVTAK